MELFGIYRILVEDRVKRIRKVRERYKSQGRQTFTVEKLLGSITVGLLTEFCEKDKYHWAKIKPDITAFVYSSIKALRPFKASENHLRFYLSYLGTTVCLRSEHWRTGHSNAAKEFLLRWYGIDEQHTGGS